MRQRLADESGVSLVIVALSLPVLILMMSLVLDVGNWFEHKRHLQMEADAAAFAGGDSFAVPCSDTPILSNTNGYSGAFSPNLAGVDNSQVGGTPYSRMHIMINSPTYFGQTTPVDSTVKTGGPCTAGMVDVKLTETDLPWFFKVAGVKYIDAHARVQLRRESTGAGVLPIAVPDAEPKVARAYFIDEATGTTLDSVALTDQGSSNGLEVFSNIATPKALSIGTSSRIGIRIALGGQASTTCGDPLVSCYDATGSNGIGFIQGYSTSGGTGTQPTPVVRDVKLIGGTTSACADSYFISNSASCNVRISANIATGGTGSPATNFGATVTGSFGGQSNITLTWNPANSRWESGNIPVAAAAGAQAVSLAWAETKGSTPLGTCKNGNNNPCSGTFSNVQRMWSATAATSGPISVLQVCDVNLNCGTDSQPQNISQNMVIQIGVAGNLKNATSVSDMPVPLRVTGNQNQSLDCDPNQPNLKSELQFGCAPQYTINTGAACTGGYGPGPPYMCVPTQTGNALSQVADGINSRLFGTTKPSQQDCASKAPNNWASFPNLSPADPRIVQLFLTPFGTFQGSGNQSYPVINFATFYLTGWSSGGNKDDPCNGDDSAAAGTIVGHFIKYIDKVNNGGGGSACDLNGFGNCVAVLTE